MVATIVLLMLVAWLICTAIMTVLSSQGLREQQPTSALRMRHVSGGPAEPPPVSPISASEPRER